MSTSATSGAKHSFFFFSSRRRHTRCSRDWSSDVCSSDLEVVLRLPSEERRTQTPRPLEVPPLQHGTPARRKRCRQYLCRRFANLSRGTLGIRLWRHSKTWVRTQACAREAGNIVGDEQQCCLVTPKNPRSLGVGVSTADSGSNHVSHAHRANVLVLRRSRHRVAEDSLRTSTGAGRSGGRVCLGTQRRRRQRHDRKNDGGRP